jgi:hypothetical protein
LLPCRIWPEGLVCLGNQRFVAGRFLGQSRRGSRRIGQHPLGIRFPGLRVHFGRLHAGGGTVGFRSLRVLRRCKQGIGIGNGLPVGLVGSQGGTSGFHPLEAIRRFWCSGLERSGPSEPLRSGVEFVCFEVGFSRLQCILELLVCRC